MTGLAGYMCFLLCNWGEAVVDFLAFNIKEIRASQTSHTHHVTLLFLRQKVWSSFLVGVPLLCMLVKRNTYHCVCLCCVCVCVCAGVCVCVCVCVCRRVKTSVLVALDSRLSVAELWKRRLIFTVISSYPHLRDMKKDGKARIANYLDSISALMMCHFRGKNAPGKLMRENMIRYKGVEWACDALEPLLHSCPCRILSNDCLVFAISHLR